MKGIWFFDDWLVERRDCLERVWGRPTFVKEIFTEFYPPGWLGYGAYITVFYDEKLGRYAMYLAAYPGNTGPGTLYPGEGGRGVFVFRLQSDDPHNWPNPIHDPSVSPAWRGFKDVVVDQDDEPIWAYAVHSLTGTPLAERGYVTTLLDIPRHLTLGGFSDDGVHFIVDRGHPWQDPGADNSGDILWNQRAGVYEILTRCAYVDRRIAISTTADFERFSRPVTALQPDTMDRLGTEFYDMPPRSYEDMYIGLLHVYTTDRFEEARIKFLGRMETQLAYSYNGFYWHRPVREPFIGIRDYGLQGGGTVYGMEMLRSGDKLLFYVHASKGGHADWLDIEAAGLDTTGYKSPLLYEMRLDGFCSLKTWGRDGVLRTKTIIPKTGEMSINVRTTAHTAIRVQMLDGETAEPIPGYTWEETIPISGDHLFARPRWKERSDISELVDRPVRIEIAMREAELFAIRMDCEAFYTSRATLQTLW